MITNMKVIGHEIHVRHELEPIEIEILKHLKEHGYIEFRGMSPDSFDRDRWCREKSHIYDTDTTDLYHNGFIKYEDMAWHLTYKLTKKGSELVKELV